MTEGQKSLWQRIKKILEIKKKREDALKMEIGRIERDMSRVERRADVAMAARRTALRTLRQARLKSGARFHPSHADYLRQLDSRITRCDREKKRLEESKKQTRDKLTETMRSRRLLEKQGQKLEAELRTAAEQNEQKAVDEEFARRFAQKGVTK